MSISPDLSRKPIESSPKAPPKVSEEMRQSTQEVLPKEKMEDLPPAPKIGVHEDDLMVQQDRMNTIDAHFERVCDVAQKFVSHVGNELQKRGHLKETPQLNQAMDKLVLMVDKARNQAAHGEFDLAKETCAQILHEMESSSKELEKDLLEHVDGKVFDKKTLTTFLDHSFQAIHESIQFAEKGCKDCELYLANLEKAASVEVPVIEKGIIKKAFEELHEARSELQSIWDGKPGDMELAKVKVKDAAKKCRDLSWVPANAAIAKKAMVDKAQLAASLIPKATAEKIVVLATTEFGTLEKPGTVQLGGRQYEVSQSLIGKGHHVIRLPKEEQVLGKGAWNIVFRVANVSNNCFQALRKPIAPPGAQPQGEQQISHSMQIYKDVGRLKGTTVGPESLIRGGTGGVLTSLYSNDLIKWLQMMPPSDLRWESFKKALSSYIEFARAGNVHGDLHPGNLSVVYDTKKEVKANPGVIKIEDLDGASHIVEGYDQQKNPIYNKNAFDAGIVCKFASQNEVDQWIKSIGDKDLPGLAKVRFGQDILAMGITLYQILTLDFEIDNVYNNKECAPFTDMQGNAVPGKFEEGIFLKGKPNLEAVRFALEDYKFLTNEQKEQVVQFIALAITQNPAERARLEDLEAAMNI